MKGDMGEMDWERVTWDDWVVHSAVPLSSIFAEVKYECLPHSSDFGSLRTVIFVNPLHLCSCYLSCP